MDRMWGVVSSSAAAGLDVHGGAVEVGGWVGGAPSRAAGPLGAPAKLRCRTPLFREPGPRRRARVAILGREGETESRRVVRSRTDSVSVFCLLLVVALHCIGLAPLPAFAPLGTTTTSTHQLSRLDPRQQPIRTHQLSPSYNSRTRPPLLGPATRHRQPAPDLSNPRPIPQNTPAAIPPTCDCPPVLPSIALRRPPCVPSHPHGHRRQEKRQRIRVGIGHRPPARTTRTTRATPARSRPRLDVVHPPTNNPPYHGPAAPLSPARVGPTSVIAAAASLPQLCCCPDEASAACLVSEDCSAHHCRTRSRTRPPHHHLASPV